MRGRRRRGAVAALRWPLRGLALAALAWIVLLGPGSVAQEEPEGALVLELCEGYVASAELVPPESEGGAWAVAVQLMPEAAESFAQLTEDHQGRVLEILLGAEHRVRARIRAPIRSGVLTAGGYATRAEAEEAREAALASRTRPCPAPGPAEEKGEGSGAP